MPHGQEELLILAPSHECATDFVPWQVAGPKKFRCSSDTSFNQWVEEFVDCGVFFSFDEDQRLPRELPACLDHYRCIVIEQQREAELRTGETGETLREFHRNGGYIFVPPEGYLEPAALRGWVQRVIVTAGLRQRHPGMLRKLGTVDDDRLIRWWLQSLPEQFEILQRADAGWAWGDPVAYHLYWPVWEAAQYFQDQSILDPMWEMIRNGLDIAKWPGALSCGSRFALKYYEKVGDPNILQRVLNDKASPESCSLKRRFWQHQGININMDLTAPAGCDPADVPERVSQNIWAWCELAGGAGDSLGYLSQVTGNPQSAETAVKQVLTTHQWCFSPDISLWYHFGRPSGPDKQSAPWGRGNGWLLYGIRGLLEDLPATHPARKELIQALALGLEGLVRYQGPYGLWHNVLDADETTSRQESCTAWMFPNVYARAYWKGWLRDERIPEMCTRAWQGLKSKLWRGLPIAHCGGTSYMASRQAYLERPHTKFLGQGALLAALEIRRMNRPKF